MVHEGKYSFGSQSLLHQRILSGSKDMSWSFDAFASQSLLHQRILSGSACQGDRRTRPAVSIASSSANTFRLILMATITWFNMKSQSLLHQRILSGSGAWSYPHPSHQRLNRFFISEYFPAAPTKCCWATKLTSQSLLHQRILSGDFARCRG